MRDVAKTFKAAPWTTPDEAQAFAREAGVQPAAEMAKLLGVLLDRASATQAAQHRARCAAFRVLAEQSVHRELFQPYARALRTGDPSLRALLVELLPKVNNVEHHGELCQVLGDETQEVRSAAATVLTAVASPQSLELLTTLAASEGFAGRMDALDALVPKAKHRALPLIGAVLKHGNPRERAQALKWAGDRALMEKALAQAAQLIGTAVSDPHDRVVAQAAKSLGGLVSEDDYFKYLGQLQDAKNVSAAQAFIDALRHYKSARVLNVLGRTLRVAPQQVRMTALDALSAIGTDDVVPLVIEALNDKQIQVRTRAVDVLTELSRSGKVELARTVIWLLRSRDVNLRRMAAELARKVGDPDKTLVPKLLRFLRDHDWWVRERVMDALVEMSGSALTQHIVEYLTDESPVVRRFAIGALRRVNDPRSLGALVRAAMSDGDWWVREEAISVISELKDARAVPYFVQLLEDAPELRITLLAALRKLAATAAAPAVADVLSDTDGAVRRAAVELLAEIGSKSLTSRVKALEADPEPAVREAVRTTLQRWDADLGAAATADGLSLLDRMLVQAVKSGADDVLLGATRPPYIKRLGKMGPFSDRAFSEADLVAMLLPTLNDEQRANLERLSEVDYSYSVKSHELRFRANVFRALTGLSAVFRAIRSKIPEFETLGLPPVVQTFGDLKHGLVLVGGPTGAGKSTTLAALIDYINRTSARHIVTIEDPIEVVHGTKQCLINQRETETHTRSFERALRSTLRQDPDVILVGEMRDLETIGFAVTAAETGHLVFGTVHTVSADTTIDRLLNAFPPGQRAQVRSMLSETLRAVVCQHLVRRKDKPGERVLAVEVMLNNDAIGNLIRKDKSFQIPSVVATHREQGMQSMDAHLTELVKRGVVDQAEAYAKAVDKKLFETGTEEAPAATRDARSERRTGS